MSMTAAASLSGPSPVLAEWKQGWPVVLAGLFGLGVTSLYFYAIGLLIVPLNKAFGWTQAEVTTGPLIISLFYFLLAARVGVLVDRVGVRKVVLPGYAAFCLALAALGLAGPSIWTWYALWALLALVFTATSPSLWALAVVGQFDRSRALALSVALCSTGIMAFLTPLIEAWALTHGGWRLAYFLLGGGMLVLGMPVLYFCLPRKLRAVAGAPPVAVPADLPGLTLREALRSPRFWIIASASLLIGGSIGALMVHLPSIGLAKGLTVGQIAGIASLIGLTAIVGRLVTGFLMDQIAVRIVATVTFALPAIACVILMTATTSLALAAAAILIGIVSGGDYNALALLTSRYLGMRNYAAIYGQIAAAFNIGVSAGPFAIAALHDRIHVYPPLLAGLAIVFVAIALITLLLGREPKFA